MSVIGTIHEDVTTDVLGKIGCWQWLVTLVSLSFTSSVIFNQYDDIFLLQPAEVYCISPNDDRVINTSLCSVTLVNNGTEDLKCNKWHLKLMWLIWLNKSWLIFCDHNLKILSTAIISRLGLMFGYIVFGLVSDSFGRRKAVVINSFSELFLGLLITFCDSEGWFRLIVFLKSLLGSANYYMGVILVCEIVSNSWRTCTCLIVTTPRLLALICTVPLAASVPNLETYSFLACIYSILCLILIRWSPESPQWLLFNRKINVAEKILFNAAKTNGIKLCEDFKIRPVNHRAYNSLDETATCVGTISIYNIKVIFIVSIVFWLLYCFHWSFLYVRLYREEDVKYLLLKIIALVVLLGCLTILLSSRLPLRQIIMLHVILSGACSAGIILMKKGTLRSVLAATALTSGIVIHALIIVITPRLFAINIRATIIGCCHASGQIGSMISYLLFLFHSMNDLTFLVLDLSVAVVLLALCCMLPDVDNRELPDITEDMDYFSELSKPLRWVTQKTNSPSKEEIEMRVYSFGSAARSLSTHSGDRLPAQPIGTRKLWQRLAKWLRRKCCAKK